MIRKQLKSGNYVEITIADIMTGYKVYQAFIDKINQEGWTLKDLNKVEKNMILLGDSNIMNVIMECAKKCVYECLGNKQKVSYETFENEENRSDFLEVCGEILIANIEPFLPKAPMK